MRTQNKQLKNTMSELGLKLLIAERKCKQAKDDKQLAEEHIIRKKGRNEEVLAELIAKACISHNDVAEIASTLTSILLVILGTTFHTLLISEGLQLILFFTNQSLFTSLSLAGTNRVARRA